MHAAQKGAIIDIAPRQQSVEWVRQRKSADAQAHCIVSDGFLRGVIKSQVTEVGVRIETAKIRLAEVHEDIAGFLRVT